MRVTMADTPQRPNFRSARPPSRPATAASSERRARPATRRSDADAIFSGISSEHAQRSGVHRDGRLPDERRGLPAGDAEGVWAPRAEVLRERPAAIESDRRLRPSHLPNRAELCLRSRPRDRLHAVAGQRRRGQADRRRHVFQGPDAGRTARRANAFATARRRSAMAAGIVHELKNPLAASK